MTNPVRTERAKLVLLLVLCAAMFLDSLDTSLVSVALPDIKNDLGMTTSSSQWIISAYTVTYGGFLLLGGRLADLFGRRRVFFVSMVVFALASLAGGLVSSGDLLIVTRLAKGIAAACTAPAALSIITTTFKEGRERNQALAFYAATAASGYSFGLVLSGLLTQASWRLVFLLPVAVAAVVVVLSPGVVPADPPAAEGTRRGFDLTGALTATGGVLLLVYGLVQAPELGWGSPTTIVTFAVALLLLVAFVVVEHHSSDPILPLRLLRSWTRGTSNGLAVLFGCASLGWQFVATLYLQQFLGYSPIETALAMLPLGVVILVVAKFVTPRLLDALPPRLVAGPGYLVQAVGITLFAFAGADPNYAGLLLPGLLLHAIGNGLVFPTINICGVSGVEDSEQGIATGLITASVQIGIGVGVAVASGVLTAATTGTSAAAQLHGFHAAFLTAAGFAVLASALGFTCLRRPAATAPTTAPTEPAEITAEPSRGARAAAPSA